MTPKSTPRRRREALFRTRLLRWFRRHGRDLPWRRTRDPWAILVSEFMLQQTQVRRVTEYFGPFLEAYPTPDHLARATPTQVRESWHGLGYYRRATNLHLLSRHVQREHGGRLPEDVEALRHLPGVGEYTAGAVASFAYGRRVAAVDTNVARVVRRAFHPRTGKGAAADRKTRGTIERLLPVRARDVWSFNQAMMDLGATICTARVARCGHCPVRPACSTGRRGLKTQPKR